MAAGAFMLIPLAIELAASDLVLGVTAGFAAAIHDMPC
jgi:hypothetical protein